MDTSITKQFFTVKAVIVKDGKALVMRESDSYAGGTNHGKYAFPGGKVELGESVEETLRRQVREETGLEIAIGKPFYVDEWRPTIHDEHIQIIAAFLLCESVSTEVKLNANHDDYQWVPIREKSNLPLIDTVERTIAALANSNLL